MNDLARRKRATGPEVDDLTIALLLVPGLFPRNRMFSVNQRPEMRRAKRRAAMLRGVQLELERVLTTEDDVLETSVHDDCIVLSYVRKRLDYRRKTTLTRAEADAMAVLLLRRGIHVPWPFDKDKLTHVTDRLRVTSGIHLEKSG